MKSLRTLPVLFLALTSMLWAGAARAQGATAPAAEPPAWPGGITTAWRLIGIDAAAAAEARPALTASAKALAAATIDTPQSLTKLIETKRPVPLVARHITDAVTTGTSKTPGLVPVVIEPTWVTVMDHEMIAVTVADATRNQLLGSAHTTIPRVDWERAAKAKSLAQRLSAEVTRLAEAALAKAAQHPSSKPGAKATDALHLGFSLARNVTRRDEGYSHAFTMLLEERFAPDHTVARLDGLDVLATARDLLGLPPQLRRPTRVPVLAWHNEPEPKPKRTLPANLRLRATAAESTGGRHIPWKMDAQVAVQRNADGTLAVAVPDELSAFVAGEQNALLLADMPQAVKVYRGWVYVDRGRAWGLKIGDRLVASVDGKPVKGHVVRYYGPEEKLASPRGFPINEGAIVYIRKGQKLPKPGTTFGFDPRTFPTPWPPQKDGP